MSHHHSAVAAAVTLPASYRLLHRPLLQRLLHRLLHLLLERPTDLNDAVGVTDDDSPRSAAVASCWLGSPVIRAVGGGAAAGLAALGGGLRTTWRSSSTRYSVFVLELGSGYARTAAAPSGGAAATAEEEDEVERRLLTLPSSTRRSSGSGGCGSAMEARQSGHDGLARSHGSTQLEWKAWRHAGRRRSSSSPQNTHWHTAQSLDDLGSAARDDASVKSGRRPMSRSLSAAASFPWSATTAAAAGATAELRTATSGSGGAEGPEEEEEEWRQRLRMK